MKRSEAEGKKSQQWATAKKTLFKLRFKSYKAEEKYMYSMLFLLHVLYGKEKRKRVQ